MTARRRNSPDRRTYESRIFICRLKNITLHNQRAGLAPKKACGITSDSTKLRQPIDVYDIAITTRTGQQFGQIKPGGWPVGIDRNKPLKCKARGVTTASEPRRVVCDKPLKSGYG